jgi:hypothetical protein
LFEAADVQRLIAAISPNTAFFRNALAVSLLLSQAGRPPQQQEMIMHHMQEMIATHPSVQGNTNETLIRCIEECYSCAQTCYSCADACLAEESVDQLRQCIRLNLDCADLCLAAGTVGVRRTGTNEQVIAGTMQACAAACRVCAEECEKHASKHEHCRICAEHCRRCEQACSEAAKSVQ